MEGLDHLQDCLAALECDEMLVEVGEFLELLDYFFEQELVLGVFLHLSTIIDVYRESLAKQLSYFFNEFLDLLAALVPALPAAIEEDVPLVYVVRGGVVAGPGDGEVVGVLPVPVVPPHLGKIGSGSTSWSLLDLENTGRPTCSLP